MKRHLILSDLDGTLASNNGEVGLHTQKVLKQVMDSGHIFCICTGRMIQSVKAIANAIDPRIICVGSNGGIIDDNHQKVIHEMAKEDLHTIHTLTQKAEIPVYYFGSKVILYSQSLPHYFIDNDASNRVSSGEKTRYIKIEETTTFEDHDIVNALVIANEDQISKLHALKDALRSLDDCNVTSSHFNNIEIFPKTSSKGIALEALRKQFDIEPEHTLAFGDGNNDIEMLKAAHISVAVSNATEALKEIATVHIGSNEAESVATYLETYFKGDLK